MRADGSDTVIGLRNLADKNRLMDVSHTFVPANRYQELTGACRVLPLLRASSAQCWLLTVRSRPHTAYQTFRYLDCDMHYKDEELNILLRALQQNVPRERRVRLRCGSGAVW